VSKKSEMDIKWFRVGDSDFALSADRYCWRVGRRVLVKSCDKQGETVQYDRITFHPSIENCFKELLSRKIKQADVKSVSDLLQAIRDAHEWLRGEFEAIERITNK